MSLITPVILCGGSGTRLWPLSRENLPKQFAILNGTMSTFQQTLKRVSVSELFAPPLVITNTEFRFLVAEQVGAVGMKASIILEPKSMDSGAAIAAAAAYAGMIEDRDLLLILASDHLIPDATAFNQACSNALAAAQSGFIVTFGIRPREPATSYGYIRPGQLLDKHGVHKVEAFMEKPDAANAQRYVDEGCFWNSGNLLCRGKVLLSEMARYAPRIKAAAEQAVQEAVGDSEFFRLQSAAFEKAERKSFDHAVMEKTAVAAVLPVAYDWSDVGSWNALWAVADKDQEGNMLEGPVAVLDTSNSLVRADEGVLTTVIGLNNVIVVATGDAVLVVGQGQAERVKDMVGLLKDKGRREVSESKRVYRPWGFYQCADIGPRFQVKRISVKPGAQLSLQKHMHRSEHWIIVRGTAEVTINEAVRLIHENESTYIPIGAVHRLRNPGRIELELIEVQVGSYLGEDDIIRIDDAYGRE